MSCLLTHNWAWPRRRQGHDVQVCTICGRERLARVQFTKTETRNRWFLLRLRFRTETSGGGHP